MRWQSLIGGAIGLGLPTLTAAVANNELHLPPYDFLMGNHIDSHMENKLQKDGSLNASSGATGSKQHRPVLK